MTQFIVLLVICFASVAVAHGQALPSGVYSGDQEEAVRREGRIETPLLRGTTTVLKHLETSIVTLEPYAFFHAGESHGETEELIIVTEGEVRVAVAGESRMLAAGSAVVVLPGDLHGIQNAGEAAATCFLFQYQSRAPSNITRGHEAGGSLIISWDDLVMKETSKGGRRNYFDQPTSMYERFEMHVTTLNPGLQSHPPHTHEAEEFILVLRGHVEEYIDGAIHEARASDLIFLASEVPHTIKNVGSEQAVYFAFQWE